MTKLSDTVSKLTKEVKLSKVTRDVESEQFGRRLTDLREAHNRQSALIGEHSDTSKKSFDVLVSRISRAQKMIVDLGESLNAVGRKLTTHGHDGLSLITQLSSRLEQADA